MMMSPAVLAGDVAVRVALPAVAGAASQADLAQVVAIDVTSLADAGMVTVGVASLANAGMVTVGVTDLADAGSASLADPAGHVAGGMTDLGVQAHVRIEEIPLLPDCVVRDCDVIDDPEYIYSEMSCDDCVSAVVCCQEMSQIRNDSGCQYVNYVSCVPVGMDCDVPADGCNCSFETLLSEPLYAVMDGVA